MRFINYLILIILFVFVSSFIHEGVHYIQSIYDNRVEFNKFGIDYIGMFTEYNWTTDNIEEQKQFENEWYLREIPAYTIQILIIIGGMYYLRKLWC